MFPRESITVMEIEFSLEYLDLVLESVKRIRYGIYKIVRKLE